MRPTASNGSFRATEPENRLIAAELEKRWNNALTHITEMERRLEEASALAPQLTAEQCQPLLVLGNDVEQLWDHPRSSATLKKRILRTVLHEVIADTTDDPPSVHLKLHWTGRFTHRAHRAQEPDGLSQPHQPGGSDRVDSRARFSL
jgi:hypothetical protein